MTLYFLLFIATAALASSPVSARIDSLWTNGSRSAALSLLEAELPLARAAHDSALVSNLLVMKGAFNNYQGQGQTAELVLREGVAMARVRRDSTLLLSGIRWLGLAVGSQGRREEAMVLYQELLELGIILGDRRHQGWANIGLGWSNWRNGQAELALSQYQRAAELFPGADDVQGELWANNGIAMINNELGRYDQVAAGYLATIEVARAHNQPMSEAVALNNLGTLEFSLGRSDLALDYFQQAKARHVQLGNKRQQVSPLFNISLCQNELGQYDAARQTLAEALTICDANGYLDLRSRALAKMAGMELQKQRLNKAAKLLQEAMSDPQTMLVEDMIGARIDLGEAYRKQKNFTAAAHQFSLADSLLGDKSFTWLKMRLQGHQAQVFRALGEPRRALDQLLALAENAGHKGMPEFRLAALSDAAQTCLMMDRPDTARTLYETAAMAWEEDRRLLLSPQWRERRGARGRKIFSNLASLIAKAGDPTAAFDLLQAYKARTLLERMLGPGETFARSLSMTDDHHAHLAAVQTTVLAPNELLLDFTLGPQVSLLYAVTRDTMVLRRLPAADEITSRVRAYYDLLRNPDAGSPAALSAVGQGLKDLLLADLFTVFADKERILVAPDGALNLLPFAELEIPGRSVSWARIPSASVLMKLRRDVRPARTNTWRTLAVASGWGLEASQLAGTLREVEHLARDYRQVEARILYGTETEVPSLTGYDVLHLAAHASNHDQSPWQSAIHFLPEEQGGRLGASDILGLQLTAGLAVLSSCSSGTGKILSGEGVLGLSSAFLSAGVPAVLASLWAVDDGATARFMELFYGFLADGQDCARALASAQQEMRGQPSTRHPYYWAGFVLIGDGSVQPQIERSADWLILVAFGLLALSFLISMVWLRRR